MVLECSCHDFAGGRTGFIHEDNERHFLEAPFSVTSSLLSGRFPALCIDYKFIVFEELVGDTHSRFHIPSKISAEVDDERLHTFSREVVHSHHEFVVCGASEGCYPHVSRCFVEHIGCIDAWQRHIVSDDCLRERLLPSPEKGETDRRAFRSFEQFHGCVVADDILSYIWFSVDCQNSVPRLEAYLVGRSTLYDPYNTDCVVIDGEAHTYAGKTAIQFLH